MTSGQAPVCVVIAAMNASGTIARAVGSALREREVCEVLVVDDGSSDDTAEVSLGADDGTGRLRILRLETNRGPAFARNHAIARSTAPLIAILDADDFFLPGRFKTLLAQDDWDFAADNIAFIDARHAHAEQQVGAFAPEPRVLDLAAFIEGNISRRGASRGEIGFLKPVMRRGFLEAHGLHYREELRLGEDYDLYARALLRGARYKVVHACGYGAVVRHNSLSGQHRTLDLKRLYEADRAMLASGEVPAHARRLLEKHERHIRARYELRRFLDEKKEGGLMRAGLRALTRPTALPAIVGGVAADKLEAFNTKREPVEDDGPAPLRYLLPARPAAQK
ncbi:glycosyltransferase family 2 protein [Mesorhizobium sp. KR2-14]|uniref:glycosyltransferase family 2 protein n=1 Tax=Mesorhizobium sp. KR2-14 TaxID=3156610 RepID=UPI0032B31809